MYFIHRTNRKFDPIQIIWRCALRVRNWPPLLKLCDLIYFCKLLGYFSNLYFPLVLGVVFEIATSTSTRVAAYFDHLSEQAPTRSWIPGAGLFAKPIATSRPQSGFDVKRPGSGPMYTARIRVRSGASIDSLPKIFAITYSRFAFLFDSGISNYLQIFFEIIIGGLKLTIATH